MSSNKCGQTHNENRAFHVLTSDKVITPDLTACNATVTQLNIVDQLFIQNINVTSSILNGANSSVGLFPIIFRTNVPGEEVTVTFFYVLTSKESQGFLVSQLIVYPGEINTNHAGGLTELTSNVGEVPVDLRPLNGARTAATFFRNASTTFGGFLEMLPDGRVALTPDGETYMPGPSGYIPLGPVTPSFDGATGMINGSSLSYIRIVPA